MNKTDKKELRKLLRGNVTISAETESGYTEYRFVTTLNADGSLTDEAKAWKRNKLNRNCTITNVDGSKERFSYEAQRDENDDWNNIWHEDGSRVLVNKFLISYTPDKPVKRTFIKKMWRKFDTQYPK